MATHTLTSIVTGTVWKIEKQPGDSVEHRESVMILESMKMEIPIEAAATGTLLELLVAEGDAVAEGQALAILKA